MKWNDFQQNILTSYYDFRKDQDFTDVTLVCKEDNQIKAHRIVLSSCSPFFCRLLKRNNHSHPMIYMRGLKAKDLVAIVDFIYHGEASIYQEDLDGFLALAEELQLKGLAGSDVQNVAEDLMKHSNKKQPKIRLDHKQEHTFETNAIEDIDNFTTSSVENKYMVPVDAGKMLVAADTSKEDLKEKLNSMMERADEGGNKWKCTICGKTTNDTRDMRRHIESHIEGLSYPCTQCNVVSRSSNALIIHVSRHHRK